jgi:DNA polymerase, archaea type
MKTHNFILGPVDTDSISICKPDFAPFTEEEQEALIEEINSQLPELINYSHDGYFKTCVVLKAKNYILVDQDDKIKLKGSSIKDQKKEPALKEMMEKMIGCLINEDKDSMIGIYESYIKEAFNVKDIGRWATKKTITKAVLNCAHDPTARLNERKVYEAVKDVPGLQEGDKEYLYPCILSQEVIRTELKNGKIREKVIKETGLKRSAIWHEDEDKEKLMERVIATVQIFSSVFDTDTFIDYSLVKNKNSLTSLIS